MQIFKLVFLIIFSSFCFPILSAQTIQERANLEWSTTYSEPPNSFLSKIIHSDQKGFYGLRIQAEGIAAGKADVFVEYYSKDQLKLKKSKALDLKFKNKVRDFEDVLMMKGNLYFLTSFNNQAKKKNYLFAQKVNLKSLKPQPDLIKLAEVPTKNKYAEGGFRNYISKDTSKILIYALLPRKKNQPERFSLQVFDNQFNLLWSKEVTLPFDDDNFSIEEYQVDNNGNVYMLGVIYEDQTRRRRDGKPTYKYTLLAYRENGESVEEYKVDLGDKFITDLTYRVARNGDLIFSGFYSDKNTYSVKGTYFFRLNPKTRAISNKNLKAFDFDFRTEYLSDNGRKKAKNAAKKGDTKKTAELYQYALDELILRSDGGAVLIAEQYFVEQRYDYNNPYNSASGLSFGNGYGFGSRTYNPYSSRYGYNDAQDNTYYYNYNDIIVVNIKPDGAIEWTARIPKQQETSNDGGYFSSYALSIVRDKFYFLFNDNAKNYDASKNNKQYSYNGRNSIMTLAEVNKNGSVSIRPIYSNEATSITTRPKICKQIGRNEMLIYGERGRKYQFGRLTVDGRR